MSRQPRAGTAGKLVGIRASDVERSRWEAAAKHAGADLSGWLRQAADELADAGKERRRGWMRPAQSARTAVAPETLTREMAADLMAVADVRVATDCQAFLAGRGGRAKLGLMRARVASAYNRQFGATVAPGKARRGT